jgi:hypothetical protein
MQCGKVCGYSFVIEYAVGFDSVRNLLYLQKLPCYLTNASFYPRNKIRTVNVTVTYTNEHKLREIKELHFRFICCIQKEKDFN